MSKNHLEGERSLYLRMHADNPVDWYPWGDDAIGRSRAEDKPIFLSIGYSACHWCHVMARESFEDETVASVLGRSYVSVKVDREERPDLDSIYMATCRLMTGSGGWPLNVVLTPDFKPFFAATYLKRSSSPTGPGLVDILNELASTWRSDRRGLVEYSEKVADALRQFASRRERAPIAGDPAGNALNELSSSFDEENGGFDVAPKFPSPHKVLLLLQLYRARGDRRALAMATRTLEAMRAGGIYDHKVKDWHIYAYWEHILERKAVARDGLPWSGVKKSLLPRYSKTMCPKTLDLLGRAILVDIHWEYTRDDCRAIAAGMNKVMAAV